MKAETLKYLRTKSFFILRAVRRILLNCLYYFGVLGIFVTWAFKLGLYNWQFWVQLLIFAILINAHKDIDRFVNR